MAFSITGRAASILAVVGSGILLSENVTSFSQTGTGTYSIILTEPGAQALGVVISDSSDATVKASAVFTSTSEITVEFRTTSGNVLADPANGSYFQMVAVFGIFV